MEAFGTRMRGGLATLLSAALILSGALLAAPAASAEEPVAQTPVAEAPAVEAPSADAPAPEAPTPEAPVEGDQPATEEAPAETPAEEAPAAEAPAEPVPLNIAQLATAAAPAVVSTEALRAGGEITVTGSGFNPVYPGVYIGIGPAGLPGFYMGASSLLEVVHVGPTNVDGSSEAGRTAKLNADGTFTTKFSVPAFAEGASYALYVSKAHGQGMSDTSQNVISAVTYAAPVVAAPAVEVVGSVTDLDPKATNTVTVKGSGFVPNAPATSGTRPPLAGKFTGAYVAFGSYASVWQPSTGAAAATRSGVETKWALLAADMATVGGAAAGAIEVKADGTFETTLTLTPDESKQIAGGSWGIVTYPGGGAKYAPFETFTPVTFKAPVAAPAVEVVGSVTDLDPKATNTVTVKGSGFVPNAPATSGTRPPLAGKFTGAYVAFGSYASVWQPSTGAAAATRSGVETKWALLAADMATVGGAAAGAIEVKADGTFETTLTLTPDESKQIAGGSWGIVTYPGGGAKYAPFETFTPVTFKDASVAKVSASTSVVTEGLKVDVAATGLPGKIYAALIERGTAADLDMSKPDSYAAFATPFPTVTDGNATFSLTAPMSKLDRKKQYEVLVWKIHSMPTTENVYGLANVTVTEAQWNGLEGIKPPVVTPPVKPQPTQPGAGSLTWGISSSFANYVTGTIAKGSISTNGVGGGRGGYVFPQATGSSWNADTRTGTVRYSGTVTFTGHGGLLSETFSNPVITVSSPTSGSISAGGQSFPLNLAGAGFVANADGSATWTGVSVGGAISGGDGAGAGGSLGMDSLSFTVGSASALNFGSTSTVSQFAKKREAAATAPATTGLTVVTPAAKLVAGGEIEITAGGFQPNEQGILVVIYSDPTVLDTNAKADANGVVRWIGTLPKDLAGKHTITLQGSVNVGQEITIAKAGEVKEKTTTVAAETSAPMVQAAAAGETSGVPAWAWWTGALALLVIAGAGTALVVAQRRKVDAPTHL